MQLTNPRIASLTPTWASFRGFTLLFDNPGHGLGANAGDRVLTTDPETDFYKAVRTALAEIDSERQAAEFGLCWLPADTYHVTAWDGINDANVADVTPQYSDQANEFLTGLPHSLREPAPFTLFAEEHLCDWQRPLTFRFESLVNWRNHALGAQLCPVTEGRANFAAFEARRAMLNDGFHAEFGTKASSEYGPHSTLGYFANEDDAERSHAQLAAWQSVFVHRLHGHVLRLQQISLYGFTNLTHFVKYAG